GRRPAARPAPHARSSPAPGRAPRGRPGSSGRSSRRHGSRATRREPTGTTAPNWTPAAGLGDAGAVTTEAAPPTDEATDGAPAEREGRRWGLGRLAVLGAVVGLVAMWAYVVYLAVGPGRQPPIDRLDDPALPEAAGPRWAAAGGAAAVLPVAAAVDAAAGRAGVPDAASAISEAMPADLAGMLDLVPGGERRERAAAWLSAWRTYLGDRRACAEALRVDPEA